MEVDTVLDMDGQTWNIEVCHALIEELWALRRDMLENEARLSGTLEAVAASYQASARNLAHYLALRSSDHRPLQEKLAWLGLFSLGRAESHVLANLDKVLGILHRLTGQPWQHHSNDEPVGIRSSRKLLEKHTADLLGAPPAGRSVRIMLTLPSEAATDYGLVSTFVLAGMDIARINCAHDSPADWEAMAAHVRRAAEMDNRRISILMDLGGPKLRTGPMAPSLAVLKLKPMRNELGRVTSPGRLGLRPPGNSQPVEGALAHLAVDEDWLKRLKPGDHLDLTDARGAKRTLLVIRQDGECALVECGHTVYFVPETRLKRRRNGRGPRPSALFEVPQRLGALHLRQGDYLRLTPDGLGQPASTTLDKGRDNPNRIACTLPEVFGQVFAGEHIWFDDGRIGGVVAGASADWLDVEITQAREEGEKLEGDKGINLPDSELSLPALTEKDIVDLDVVARLADLVGLSFAQRGEDVAALRHHLQERGAPDLGILLKIETRRGFEILPELIFSAMGNCAAGIMIARGDLAVECGYERLAEVQEEILWAAEAAHMPVVWATQVLETLAKTGLPSRAEITDAAMGERAECVMLNKGPHIVDAIHTLHDILRRMQSHQAKKRPLLRELHAWQSPTDGAFSYQS
jgi:pyruvate kinase